MTLKLISLLLNEKLTKLENRKQKTVYCKLISKISSQPTTQKRFTEKYPQYTFEWESIYLQELPRKVTVESKTRDFQYNILNRILFTNKMLFKMKISDINIDKFTFCNEEETTEHLLTIPANIHYFSGKKLLSGLKCTILMKIWMN